MLIDYHMHTRLTDGVDEPVDYARVAVERGLDEIGFSDHAPRNDMQTDWNMKLADLDEYVDMVQKAQRQFPQINIKLGLEVDFIPGCEAWVRELAGMYRWDYLLGSVHWIGGWPVDLSAKNWAGCDVAERWHSYFNLWKQAAQTKLFDSLAHPDLPKKFGHRPTGDLTGLYEDALSVVAASGAAIEISTAGLRKPCLEIYPSEAFLKIAHRLHVPITFGSDAHLPYDVGTQFEKAVALARRCGYENICRFTFRKRDLVPLG